MRERACSPEDEPLGIDRLAVISFFRVFRLDSNPGCKGRYRVRASQPYYRGHLRVVGSGITRHGFASLHFLIFGHKRDYLGNEIIQQRRSHCSCSSLCREGSFPTFWRLLSSKLPSISRGFLRVRLNPAQTVNPQNYELTKWCLL